MPQEMPFPRRMIHLDFHTGPAIPDVGRYFDPDEFARTFAEAHVDSVTVFAKCHHGHLYYNTDRPERHPGLVPGLDLLAEQIEALHSRDIRAPIYISVQCDEYAANTHPEWIAIDAQGKQVKGGGPLAASWQILDMSSPYQDYLADQIDEVLSRFSPVDGVFLDMCWDQPSLSKWAIDGMRKRGYDPREEDDRRKYSREVAHAYMGRYKEAIDRAQDGHAPAGIWFNSRPKTNLHIERKFLRHIEVECLPTGGWGYAYFPYVARFVRPLNLPTLSHTGRFHQSWGDFGSLKPEAAMKYECCLILSQGMTSGVGDQLHPRGTLDPPAYAEIGRIYGHIQACEPWVAGGTLLSEIAVLVNPEQGDNPGPVGLGVVRALQQLRYQFDLLPPSANLDGYPVVIVPESIRIDTALASKLADHLAAGGGLLVSGAAALDENGQPAMEELGILTSGESPYSDTYVRPVRGFADSLAGMDHIIHKRGFRMAPQEGAHALASVVEPYFERTYEHFCSHSQTPPDRLSPYSMVVQNGQAITVSVPIFTIYGTYGNIPVHDLIRACLAKLLPEPLIHDGGPAHLETSVVKKDETTVVHLISYCPVRRTPELDLVDDPFPLVEMPLSVKLPRPPKRVILAPENLEIPFEYRDGRAEVKITCLDGHVMVVLE
ncbi:MAG TPA: alpha-amylase family protein [Armatimonadota bacterium]|nr:alpha-amylase family protein [Armatimonadota bacterium]